MTDNTGELPWYVVSRDGIATLCASEEDARAVALESDKSWRASSPHRAMQLVDAEALASRDAEIARVHAAYCHSQQQFLDAQAELAKLRQGEPAAEIKWAADIVGSIMEVRLYDYELPVGTKLYASPPPAQPTQAEPLSDEDIAQLWSPHPGGEVRRPILGWGKVCDFARAIERLITERMSAGGTK